MSLLRSVIANAASRGGVVGSASSSTSAAAARSLSALSLLRSPSHRGRDDDDDYDDAPSPSVAGMMLSSRGPPLPVSLTPTTTNTKIGASSLYGDAASRLSSAIAAPFGDWTFAATTTIMDLSSKRGVEANDDVDGRGGDREDAAIFASASAMTTTSMITTTTESPQDDGGGISSTLARPGDLANIHAEATQTGCA